MTAPDVGTAVVPLVEERWITVPAEVGDVRVRIVRR